MPAPPLFAAFDRIHIVNLASRTDRRVEMIRQLARVDLHDDPRVSFFPAIMRDDKGPFRRTGSHGAFLSHLYLLEQAAAAGETVLILQDDCDFLIPQITEYQLPQQWDIFYGGYYASNPADLPGSDIIGAHFMGFSPKAARVAADYLKRYLFDREFTPDPTAALDQGFVPEIRPPIDGAFVWMRRAYPELVTVFAMMGVQRASRTDIGNQRLFDRVPGLRRLATYGRRLRRLVVQPVAIEPPVLFNAFDRIRIVNLPSRTDRRSEMDAELARIGAADDRRIAYFPAFMLKERGPFPRNGDNGCFHSHLAILKEAAAEGQSVLILEDDCDFLARRLMAYRLPESWDVFYGGYTARNPEDLHASDIIGSHFMGFSARAAAAAADYFSRYLQDDFVPDAQAAAEPGFNPEIRPPVDGAYVWMRRACPELVTVFAMLGVQRASRSDIGEQRMIDRTPGLRSLATLARRIRRVALGKPEAMKESDAQFGQPDS